LPTCDSARSLSRGDPALLGLLVLAGPLTALPLLLFAAGARRIPMTTLGVLQYIGPTIQFALGVWLFHEPFAGPRLVGFVLIWLALVIYPAESWLSMRRQAAASTEAVAPWPVPAGRRFIQARGALKKELLDHLRRTPRMRRSRHHTPEDRRPRQYR
jgi:hypothetical protein